MLRHPYESKKKDIEHFIKVSKDSNGWPPDPRVDAAMRAGAFKRMLDYIDCLASDAAVTYVRLKGA